MRFYRPSFEDARACVCVCACVKFAGVLNLKLKKKATIVMLAFGFMGKGGVMPACPAFYIGMAGWFFLSFEIFGGEAAGAVKDASPVCIGTATVSAPFCLQLNIS